MTAIVRLLCLVAASVVLAGLALPTEAQVRRNQFGPTGSMCRAACGPDCPDTCEKRSYNECISPQAFRRVDRYTCGTHQGCSDHDMCLDNCARQGTSQEGWDFIAAECNRECHMLAHDYAIRLFGPLQGTRTVNDWRRGLGPYSGRMTWEYTVDQPNGRERIGECPTCATCSAGRCRVVDMKRCRPCNSCGDVHIRTLDGLRYDFQSSGDFILVDSPDGLRIEARQVPYGRGVSVNVAVAVRSAGQVVRVWVQPSARVEIDGRAVHGHTTGPIPLAGGGELHWDQATVSLDTAEGWGVAIRLFGSFLNVGVTPPEAVHGRVSGLLGNADGDPGNDLVGRDGTAYPVVLDPDALYDGFGASWRLHPDQSLLAGLPWPDGVPREGSGRPEPIATLTNLDPLARWEAEEACRDAGLDGTPNFDACVLDFAVTGDADMLDSAVLSAEGVLDATLVRRARTPRPLASGEVALEGPAHALAGAHIEVLVAGDIQPDDLVALVPVSGEQAAKTMNWARVAGGDALQLLVPPEPGAYRLVYQAFPGREERFAQDFQVLPLQVRMEAPARARAGSRIRVLLLGDGNYHDLVEVAAVDAPARHRGNHARRRRGDEVSLLMPSLPGHYQLRYVIDQRRHLVDHRPIEVEPLDILLEAAESATAGGTLEVRLHGEANPDDLVVVVPEGAPDTDIGTHVRVGAVPGEGNREGSVLVLRRLPATPGRHEIRYLIDRGRVPVARRPLRIDPSTP